MLVYFSDTSAVTSPKGRVCDGERDHAQVWLEDHGLMIDGDDPSYDDSQADPAEVCAACRRPLWWARPPSEENGLPICAECDAARNFDVLESF